MKRFNYICHSATSDKPVTCFTLALPSEVSDCSGTRQALPSLASLASRHCLLQQVFKAGPHSAPGSTFPVWRGTEVAQQPQFRHGYVLLQYTGALARMCDHPALTALLLHD